MTEPLVFLCRCGRPDFRAEQAGVYARYGWDLASYFALLDRFTWEDDFHDMMSRPELLRLKAAYPRVGYLLADSLSDASARCDLGARASGRLKAWVARAGLHFGADIATWLSYRAGMRRTFRLLPAGEPGYPGSTEARASYARCAVPTARQN